ncbi:MAG: GHKL domain-containing protein [Faecalibacillus intestinalis]|uniref:GHKL domain-containing protein n=1 Tax=Faecalibacillus intestinalis TaxID=1982626 RepID=UPI0039995983
MDKLDFYIIFGNILENAIEHCESDKVKKINIETGKSVDGRYYFKITNSINTLEKLILQLLKE